MTLLIKLIQIYKSNEPILYMYIVYAVVRHVNIAFKDVSIHLCISKIYKFYRWSHYYIWYNSVYNCIYLCLYM